MFKKLFGKKANEIVYGLKSEAEVAGRPVKSKSIMDFDFLSPPIVGNS